MTRDFTFEAGKVSNAEARASRRMSEIDALSPDLRKVVHDYGYMIVRNFLNCGVRKPSHIRHLVETVLNEFSPTRGSYSRQGRRTPAEADKRAAALDEPNIEG